MERAERTNPKRNAIISDNIIVLNNLTNQHLILEFINSLNGLIYKFKHKEIIIDCSNVSYVTPLPSVPIVGIIDYYKETKGINFIFKNQRKYLQYSNFARPEHISNTITDRSSNLLDKFWIFSNSEEISNTVNCITASLMRKTLCEEGVVNGCIWAINEVMDNVILHSGIGKGFVMAQLNNKNSRLNVCIYDYGFGIYKTLLKSDFKPRSAVDAITLSIKEGVTRDKKIGQGNGLWGLNNIISQSDGRLSIISGKGGILFSNRGEVAKPCYEIVMLNKDNQSTTVSFILNLNNKISLKEALKGHDVTDMFIENLKGDFGDITYKIADVGSGTGTRESGLQMKNELLNIYNITKSKIIIDFDGVGIISSSFADEFIGKLIDDIGFYQYQSIFQLVNMNEGIRPIFEASLKKRLGAVSDNKDGIVGNKDDTRYDNKDDNKE